MFEREGIGAVISALKGAIRFNQHYAPAYYTLGCVYLMINNDTQAIPVLNKAIKYAPFQPQYHFKLGEALFELGKKSKDRIYIIKARDELKKASQLNRGPDLDLARNISNYYSNLSASRLFHKKPFGYSPQKGYQIKFILQFCGCCDKNNKQGEEMQKHLGFLKVSSVVVKIAAWIFLFLGIIGGTSILLGLVPGNPRWMGLIILAIYAFAFFFFYVIAKIADLLVKIINEIKKE